MPTVLEWVSNERLAFLLTLAHVNVCLGQGRVGYITGAQSPPRNAELTGWEIDSDGNLTLEGASLKACLGANNAWVVWVSVGSTNPNGYDECLGFTARTGNIKDPVSCLYTQQS